MAATQTARTRGHTGQRAPLSNATNLPRPSKRTAYTAPLSLHDFEVGKTLGRGKLGQVYCVKHKKTGFLCALKVMDLGQLALLNLLPNLAREISIQGSLDHPNLSRLYTYFTDAKRVYLVVEFSIYGELYHHLKRCKRFDDVLASYYISQITRALIYLHDRNIIHRDLKPENILVDLHHQLKITDFGWLVQSQAKRSTLCGTVDYLAPEIVNSTKYDKSIDIWALGILVYELLVGVPPFEAPDKQGTYRKIAEVALTFPKFVDADARDLVRRLLRADPHERLELRHVLVHPWITKHRPRWPEEA